MDEDENQDISEYIYKRICSSETLLSNIINSCKRPKEENKDSNPAQRFQNYLVGVSNGCFLYVKLILDLIEKGHIILKSASYGVIPQSLSEVFLLQFNQKFPSSQSFNRVSDILAVCLASLNPPTPTEIFNAVSSLSMDIQRTWKEFEADFKLLSDYLVIRKDGTVMFFHPLFREWLINIFELMTT